MPMEDPEVRITVVTLPVPMGGVIELDISEVRAIVVAEAVKWGTSPGDVAIALGDMGDFFDISGGDNIVDFAPVRRLRLRNNVGGTKSVTLALSRRKEFRILNTPRGI